MDFILPTWQDALSEIWVKNSLPSLGAVSCNTVQYRPETRVAQTRQNLHQPRGEGNQLVFLEHLPSS